MNEVVLILGMFLATFSVRYVLFAIAGKVTFSEGVIKALGFVPPAVLIAIVMPAIAMPQGSLWLDWRNPWLMAGGIAAVVAWVRKDLLTTIVVGMLSFALLRWWIN